MHKRRLEVMDLTAVSLCMENRLPIVVFNMRETGNVKRVLVGEPVGTVVEEGA
jgi:uridylate kinase